MAPERLSRLQRRILAWLLVEAQRTRGTMAASHQDLVRTLAHDKGKPRLDAPPGPHSCGMRFLI